eukprot:PLAT7443.1.p2 GENE.PLAT7443.1~~PLAT7443.1.p2  ORF type:complete len:821 (+),score=484.69 PLAT7443.1:99-2561(+)
MADLPLLPGIRRFKPRRKNYAKTQIFGRAPGAGAAAAARPRAALAATGGAGAAAAAGGAAAGRAPAAAVTVGGVAAKKSGKAPAKPAPPAWLLFDREVLRFYMYFKEAVTESREENFRVRKCTLMFYLEDSSIHISEPREDNSGIPQGVFFKRSVITNPKTGEPYTPLDFVVGDTFTLFGRTFQIVDADSKTRDYLAATYDVDVPRALPFPEDPYSALRKPKPKAKITSITGEKKPDTLRKFLKNDRKILRFNCQWDNTDKLYGEVRNYVLHYYLSDDTVEVREVYEYNSGRDAFPLLLKRQKLPKRDGSGLVTEEDLRCGEFVHVYGRDMFLQTCDAFTRQYYRDELGIRQVDVPIERSDDDDYDEEAKGAPAAAPAAMMRSTVDEMDSGLFSRKPGKVDRKKMDTFDRKVLRFQADLETTRPEDVGRRFLISYYLADDTVSIFEPPQRNSGVVGGKFLQRGVFNNPEAAEGLRPFAPQDFFVGAVVEFMRHRFRIFETDNFTLRYMEGHPSEFPMSDSDIIYGKLMRRLRGERRGGLRAVFRRFDRNNDRFLSVDEFKSMMAELGVADDLSEHELYTIMKKFDSHADGRVWYDDFVDALLMRGGERMAEEKLDEIDLALVSYLRSGMVQLRKAFRKADADHNGQITLPEFTALLHSVGFSMDDAALAELFRRYDTDESGIIDYEEFCDAVYPSDDVSPLDRGTDVDHIHSSPRGASGLSPRDYSARLAGAAAAADPALASVKRRFKVAVGAHKMELRRAFRDLDASHTGFVGEDDFLEAVSRVAPALSDDDKFKLCEKFFPKADSQLEYAYFTKTMLA